jgi:protein-disulfide isomerase
MSVNKESIQKLPPVAVAIAIIAVSFLVIGGIYFALPKSTDNNSQSAQNQKTESKPTNLDSNKKIESVSDVEEVIHRWVEANPDIIIESVVAMQQKAAAKQQQDAQKNVASNQSQLFDQNDDPVHTPKGYDVSIVEFFDYNCGYCKRAYTSIKKLIKEDKKVRVIFKELPILGPSSVELSKVSIAVNLLDSNKYIKFHDALMSGKARTKDDAIKVAKSIGINTAKLAKILTDKQSEIIKKIESNQKLASLIGINGTPAFVIGEELIPGAVGLDALKAKINSQR